MGRAVLGGLCVRLVGVRVMAGKSSLRKGKAFEQSIARILRDADIPTRRTGSAGQALGDLTTDRWSLELKNHKAFAEAVYKGVRDLEALESPEGKRRALIVKRPRLNDGRSLVVMTLDTFIDLERGADAR